MPRKKSAKIALFLAGFLLGFVFNCKVEVDIPVDMYQTAWHHNPEEDCALQATGMQLKNRQMLL
jgi:hypothetical protein